MWLALFFLYLRNFINGSRRRFCNSPCTFSRSAPWTNTSYPYSHAPSWRRNPDTPPRPYIPLQVLQNVFHKPCIYTVKKAFYHLAWKLPLYYTRKNRFWQAIFTAILHLYKTAFPSKKLSKKPPTSKPVFSNEPMRSCGVAVWKRQVE